MNFEKISSFIFSRRSELENIKTQIEKREADATFSKVHHILVDWRPLFLVEMEDLTDCLQTVHSFKNNNRPAGDSFVFFPFAGGA